MSLSLPTQVRQATTKRLLAVVCCCLELLEILEPDEVPLSRVWAYTTEVQPEGLLFWGPGLKAVPLASLGHFGARGGFTKDLEMFGVACHHAASAVSPSQAGREGGEEK